MRILGAFLLGAASFICSKGLHDAVILPMLRNHRHPPAILWFLAIVGCYIVAGLAAGLLARGWKEVPLHALAASIGLPLAAVLRPALYGRPIIPAGTSPDVVAKGAAMLACFALAGFLATTAAAYFGKRFFGGRAEPTPSGERSE